MRGTLISLWSFLDPLYYFFSNLSYLSCEEADGNIFRVKLTKYKGRNVVLSDGTRIHKNDILVKIHLHNARLLRELKEIKSEFKKAKMTYQFVERSLPGVGNYIQDSDRFGEIKGVIGITVLNKGCERLGFEVFDIQNPFYNIFKRFAFLPIGILSNKKSSFWQILKHQAPNYLFMSANTLSQLYGHKM